MSTETGTPHAPDAGPARGAAWDMAGVHHTLVEWLRGHAGAADEEQAVRGIDALAEVDLHAILREGLSHAGASGQHCSAP